MLARLLGGTAPLRRTTGVAPAAGVRKAALMIDLLRSGYPVRFRATGRSMSPAIAHNDVVTVVPVNALGLRPGDVVLYVRAGRVFAHRLVEILHAGGSGGKSTLVTRGDNMPDRDRPLDPSAVLGKVVQGSRPWRPQSLDAPATGTA